MEDMDKKLNPIDYIAPLANPAILPLKSLLNKYEIYPFSYEYFLGIGVDGFAVAVIAGMVFGAASAFFPLLLFAAFGVSLTGSTHYHPRLGLISASILLASLRLSQMLAGMVAPSRDFFALAAIWGLVQIYIIGYLPGKIITTSENLKMLFSGMLVVSGLYAVGEQFMVLFAAKLSLPAAQLLLFPGISLLMVLFVSTITTFIFTNTFCPYMMIPLISRVTSKERYCGVSNFVYNIDAEMKFDDDAITRANMRGFRLVSSLPSCTVFTCPRGGVVSVYKSGKMFIRKADRETAERIYRNLLASLRARTEKS